jgi:hypothetical protein
MFVADESALAPEVFAMRRDELMGPDLLSEVVIAMTAAALFFFLILTLVAALAAK